MLSHSSPLGRKELPAQDEAMTKPCPESKRRVVKDKNRGKEREWGLREERKEEKQ